MYYSTVKEMKKLDALAVEGGLEIHRMMEVAGWHMLGMFRKLNISSDAKVVVVCGKGNKGGDGLSAAWHLVNHGWNVDVVLMDRGVSFDSEHYLKLLEEMHIPISVYPEEDIAAHDVIIDSLIGYHLNGAPRGVFAEAIEVINKSNKTVISYDMPSGVDTDTGECLEPCVKATATLTLAMPKKLFQTEQGREASGKIFIADIGIPNSLYEQIALGSRPTFEDSLISL